MIRKLVICTMMFCLLAAGNLTGKSSSWVWTTWRKAYEDFEMGEQAGLEKQYQTALAQFRRALSNFIAIRKRQPNWNRRTVEERIALCRRKISRIKEKLDALGQSNMSLTDETPVMTPATPPAISVAPAPRSDVSAIPGSTTTTNIDQLVKERNTYKERLLRAMIELDDLKKTAARGNKSSATVQALLKEKYALERALLVQQQQYNALKKSTEEPDKESAKLKTQLMSEKVLSNSLKKQLAGLKKKIDEVNKEKEKALQSVTVDKYNVKVMTDKLTTQEDLIKRLNKKLADSDKQLLETQKSSAEFQQAGSQYKDALNKKTLEYNKLYKQLQEVRRNYTAADVKDQMLKENEKFRKKIDVLEIQLKSIYSKHDLTLQKCAKLAIENKKLKSSMANVSKRKGVYENDFDNLSKKYRELVKDNQEKKEMIRELSLKITNLNKEIKNFAARYDSMKKTSADKKLTQELVDNDTVKKLTAELEGNKKSLASTLKQNAQLNATLKMIKNDLNSALEENTKLNTKLAQTLKELKTKPAGSAELAEARKSLKLLQQENLKLKNSAGTTALNNSSQTLNELQKKKTELAQTTRKFKSLQDQYAKLTSENDSMRQYKNEYDKLKVIYDKLKTAHDKDLSTSRQYKSEYDKLKVAYDKLKATSGKDASTQEYKTKYADLKVAYDKLAKVREKYISYTADIAKFQRLKTEYEKQAQALVNLKKVMDENESLTEQVKNLRKRVFKAEKQLYQTGTAANKVKPEKTDQEIDKLKAQIKVLEAQVAQASQSKKTSTVPRMSQAKRVKTVVYLLQAAFNAEQQNDIKSAIWHYRKVLLLAPNNFTANRSLGTLLLAAGQNVEAARCLEKAFSINKNSPDVLYGLAELAIRSKSYAKAASYLDKANIMDPNSVRGDYLRAMIFKGSGKIDIAVKQLEKALEKEPESKESLMALSELLVENPKKLHAAREYYKRALDAGAAPNEKLAKKLDLASNKKKEVKPAPKEKSAAFLIKSANDAVNKEDYASAAWFYRQLTKVQPKKATEWQFCLATALIKQKKDQEAVDVLKTIVLDSKNADIGKAFTDLLKQHPDSGVLNLYYAKFLMKHSPGSRETAKQAYQNAIKNGIKPDSEFEKLLKNQ